MSFSLNSIIYAYYFRSIFTGKLSISGIFLARSLGSNKKQMKHEVYDQALKILTEKTIEEINELKDPGVESIKYVSGSRGSKTFFMLNSAETKIYPAHKC